MKPKGTSRMACTSSRTVILPGALVEFEASYQAEPHRRRLTKHRRVPKGAVSLRRSDRHARAHVARLRAQLSLEDKKAAEEAIREMSALWDGGAKITPPDARVSVNDATAVSRSPEEPRSPRGRRIPRGRRSPGLRAARAHVTRVSGQNDRPVTIALTPLSGTLVGPRPRFASRHCARRCAGRLRRMEGPRVGRLPRDLRLYATLRHKSNVVAYAGQTRRSTQAHAPDAMWPPPRRRRRAIRRPTCRRRSAEFTAFAVLGRRHDGQLRSPMAIRTKARANHGRLRRPRPWDTDSQSFGAEFSRDSRTTHRACCQRGDRDDIGNY